MTTKSPIRKTYRHKVTKNDTIMYIKKLSVVVLLRSSLWRSSRPTILFGPRMLQSERNRPRCRAGCYGGSISKNTIQNGCYIGTASITMCASLWTQQSHSTFTSQFTADSISTVSSKDACSQVVHCIL